MKIEIKRSELIKAKGEVTLSLPSIEVKYRNNNEHSLNTILVDIMTKKIEGEKNEKT
jgi:hypothetical protein